MTKGMIPIEKSVGVVDEQGNRLEPTYPKRAKGLVKKGRARYIDVNTICLIACPPYTEREDHIMDKSIPVDVQNINEKVNRAMQENPHADVGELIRREVAREAEAEISAETRTAPPTQPDNQEQQGPEPLKQPVPGIPAPTLPMEYVLTRIDRILNDTQHIRSTLEVLASMPPAQVPGDIAGQAKAEAMGRIVEQREKTNQKLISLLEKMYDDLKPSREPGAMDVMVKLLDAVEDLPPLEKKEILAGQFSRLAPDPEPDI